ncbi:hypothetical protein [Nocardia mexicana]|uniref:Uncharacterized protein n=1 Tax=Nocardia mexicana TaxID=279262 RepID=A0A370GPM4_9NOCA|nr:hypothetical protein [Nocardia mexicana]RDI45260.1 hypothetical protein DFR68_11329 [Nocardia mexicana]
MIKEFLDHRLSLRQILHLAVAAALVIGIPYLGIGLYWLSAHNDHLAELHGFDRFVSILGEVLVWPLLLVSNISLR